MVVGCQSRDLTKEDLEFLARHTNHLVRRAATHRGADLLTIDHELALPAQGVPGPRKWRRLRELADIGDLQPIYNGRVYAADRLILSLTHAQCNDGMSDNIYADTVTVTVDGVTHRGCGGGIVAPGTMANSHWSIDEIDGEPVFERGYFLEFDAERFTGRAGCNRLSGGYARDGDRLTLGPVAATRMACPEPGMGHERSVLAILGGPVTVSTPEEGDGLILTGAGGRLLLRQIVN